jgi:hypothetical protein
MFENWSGRWVCTFSVGLILLVVGCSAAGQPTVEVTPTENEASCQAGDLAENFVRIELGASRAEVTACLGQPAEMNNYELPAAPFFGPAESLTSTLEPGTPVEEWLYYAGDQTYYLWFASAVDEPKQNWRLIEKAVYPTGAVFEAK